MKKLLFGLIFSLWSSLASAGVTCTLPFTLLNNTLADATQVMANYNALVACLGNAAAAGNNNDITSLLALTTPLAPAQGGSYVYAGGTSGGSANAQTAATTIPGGFTLTAGKSVIFTAGNTNTAAMTLEVAGLTVASTTTPSCSSGTCPPMFFRQTPAGPAPMTGGEVQSGQLIWAVWDGTEFQMISNGPQFGGFGPLTNLASASTTDLGTVPSHNVNVTGATTITSFGASASTTFPVYKVVFAGGLTITYNQTNCGTTGGCILTPGGSNIVTTANDTAELFYAGTGSGGGGNWQIINYSRSNGASVVSPTPLCGFSGLLSANGVSSAIVSISWNSAVLTNSTNVPVFSGAQSVTMNITTLGVNAGVGGLDTGSVGNNIFYYLYAVYNGSTYSALASTNATAPSFTNASGYSYFCRLGAVKTNGSAALYGIRQLGSEARYVNGGPNLSALPTIVIGTTGSSCNGATPTYTAFTIQGASGTAVWVPSTAVAVDILLQGAYGGTTSTASDVAPNASYGGVVNNASLPYPILGASDTTDARTGRMLLESTAIYICNANGTAGSAGGAEFVYGWKDSVNAN